jgi:hypothetical protein
MPARREQETITAEIRRRDTLSVKASTTLITGAADANREAGMKPFGRDIASREKR